MEDVYQLARDLNDALLTSDIYKSYQEAMAQLEQNPEDYEKFKDFYKSHLDFQARLMRGEMSTFDEEKYMASLYSEVFLSDAARTYIQCRDSFMKHVCDITDMVFSQVKTDTDLIK